MIFLYILQYYYGMFFLNIYYLFYKAARLETFMFENIPVDKIGVHNNRQSNFEYLGTDMIEGGNEFGAGTPYGKTL